MSAINLDTVLRPPIRWWIKRGSGMVFDWLHQVDTGSGAAKNLEIASANRDQGIAYDSCPWSTLRQALRMLSLPVAGFTFVDIGCGKGKVLLSAAALPFRRIVGVEFSSYLSRVAEQNLASARLFRRQCPSVEIVCADAVHYPIPEEPDCILFCQSIQVRGHGSGARQCRALLSRIAAADISDILCNLVDNAADQ